MKPLILFCLITALALTSCNANRVEEVVPPVEHAVGSISEKTIIGKVSAGKDLNQISKLSVGDVMEEAFPQVGEDAPLTLISNLLQVYPAVLISTKGKVVGIVTKADLLKMLL